MKKPTTSLNDAEIYTSKALERNKARITNRDMLRESRKIALKVLMKLDELKITQRNLAELMNVSPQQISKIVSGNENLTIETQIKIQKLLNIPILASYYEDDSNTFFSETKTAKYDVQQLETVYPNYIQSITTNFSINSVIEKENVMLFETAS